MTGKIFRLSTDKAQHNQRNPTFPQCPRWSVVTHWHPSSAAESFQSLAKRDCCWKPAAAALACNESPSPEGTGWDHHLVVCKQPTHGETNHSSHACGLDMNKWPRNLGGSKSYYPLPESFSYHTKLVVMCFLWATAWGGEGVENNPKSTLWFSPKIMNNSLKRQIKEQNDYERRKCGSKGKTSLLCIVSWVEFQNKSEWIIFFNLFNYANSHHALVVLAVFSLYMYDSRITIATCFLISLQLLTINTIRQGQRWSKLYRFLKRLLRVSNSKRRRSGLLGHLPKRMVTVLLLLALLWTKEVVASESFAT